LIGKRLEQHSFRIIWDHLGWFPPQVVPVLFPRGETLFWLQSFINIPSLLFLAKHREN
jgi:hypothetical protein